MNLLKETIEIIEESGHSIEDIIFIGSVESGHFCDWEEFKILANKEYNCGYGPQQVASDLEIIFKDGLRMWRYEYDGYECWYFSKPVPELNKNHEIKSLFTNYLGWKSLRKINEDNENV